MSTRSTVLEQAPVLASPRPAEAAARGQDEHLVSLLSPASLEAEQYHVLRHGLEQLRRERGFSVFGVTSPAQADGKTTTAVNLAAALAQDPASRVLLVDADLRHPSVGASLGLASSGGPGLVGAIVDSAPLDAVVRTAGPSNLAVLPAGQCPGLIYDILQSPRVPELLETARHSYDYVVMDTPPLLLVPDCRVLARWVDSFLMVVAAHRTPRKLLEEALNVVDPAKLAGLVFNGDDRPFSAYRAYYQGYLRRAPARPGWWRSLLGRLGLGRTAGRSQGWQ
jgi:capsular exopolysaccharide synthesis family protein